MTENPPESTSADSTKNSAEQAALIVQEIVADSADTECAYYHGKILDKSRDESIPGDVRKYLNLIGQVASYHFRHENTHEPFAPMFQSSTGRSGVPSDFDDGDLELLDELCDFVDSPELLARSYDVLWLRRRKPAFAEQAITNYIVGATSGFDLEHWTFCAELAERALRLASLFRKQKPELCQSVADFLLDWVNDHSKSDERFLTARSIRLLLQFGYGDPAQLLESASEVGRRARGRGDIHCAEEYWRQAVKCARAASNEDAANDAQTELAECYVDNARRHKDSGISAAHWMQQAIEAYKAVPDTKTIREELYAELLTYQKDSLAQMGKFETSFDISDLLKTTTELMAGKSVRESVFSLAFELAHPLDYSRLEVQAKDLAEKYPLSSMFAAVHLDNEGKVVGRSDGSFGSPSGVSEREVYRLAAMEHQLTVIGKIIPAIEIITNEHEISEHDFLAVVENNPFVAPGQEGLYAKGLHAGLNRDFVVALSILIPLIENSIRTILQKFGVRISTLNSNGVQEVLRMGAILDHEKTSEIFGENTVRDLRGLLVERTYCNLRNDFSHGLLQEEAYYQPGPIYLWWLTLRLCLTPAYHADKPEIDGQE